MENYGPTIYLYKRKKTSLTSSEFETSNNAVGGHSIIKFTKTGGPKYLVPIEYPVHKLYEIITRFLVSFIKVSVLLKTSVLKKLFSVCVWNCKFIKFAKNSHLIITFHKEKFL